MSSGFQNYNCVITLNNYPDCDIIFIIKLFINIHTHQNSIYKSVSLSNNVVKIDPFFANLFFRHSATGATSLSHVDNVNPEQWLDITDKLLQVARTIKEDCEGSHFK